MLRLIEKNIFKAELELTRLSHFMFFNRTSDFYGKVNRHFGVVNFTQIVRDFVRFHYHNERQQYSIHESAFENEFSNLRCIISHIDSCQCRRVYHNKLWALLLLAFYFIIRFQSSFSMLHPDNSWEWIGFLPTSSFSSLSLCGRRALFDIINSRDVRRERRVCWNNTATFSYQTCFNDLPTVMSHEDMNERT